MHSFSEIEQSLKVRSQGLTDDSRLIMLEDIKNRINDAKNTV
jgi:hypothetical protein